MDYITDLGTQLADTLDFATDAALDEAFDADLPLLGTGFKAGLQAADPLLGSLKTQLLTRLSQLAPGSTAAEVAAAIIGSGINAKASADGKTIAIQIGAMDQLKLASAAVPIVVGSAALGFDLTGSATLALDYTLNLGLTYDVDAHVLSTSAGANTATLHYAGSLAAATDGKLGYLRVAIDDQIAGPEVDVTFGVDIADNVNATDLGLGNITTTVSGTADLKLGLVTNVASNLLPALSANFVDHYTIAPHLLVDGAPTLGATAQISLEQIELDIAGFIKFLAGVFAPIVDTIFGAFPIGPLINVLTTPIPIIDPAVHALGLSDKLDQVGDDDLINLLDIAVIAGAPADIINKFAIAFNLIKGLKNAEGGGTLKVGLGSVVLYNPDTLTTSGYIPNPKSKQDILDALSGNDGITGSANTDGLGGAVKTLFDIFQAAGVDFPVLEDPSRLIPLLLNGIGGPADHHDVDLITYKVPELSFKAGYDQFFPIIGPIGVDIGGSLHASVGLNFGYDTRGITSVVGPAHTPLSDAEKFAEGFFFSTDMLDNGETVEVTTDTSVNFKPLATVGVEFHAAAEVNIGFAEIDVGGGIAADLAAYFPHAVVGSPENDGKARLSDFDDCLLDPIAGRVSALLFIHFSINFIFFSFEHRFDLADITLAEFSFGCTAPETDPGMGLATLLSPGNDDGDYELPPGSGYQLTLNGGERAHKHSINHQEGKDGSESFEIRNARDSMGNLIPNALEVTSRTVKDDPYIGGAVKIDQIYARMGDERDVVVIAEDVKVAAHLEGGDGDDLLVGGAGNDELFGDDGFDHLIGGAGNDTIDGGDGDDLIEGGLGADHIDGGDDRDQATYEHSKSGVTFKPKQDDTSVFVGTGGEAQGDTLTNIEYLIGSHFNDVLYANPDEDSTIEALDGNDILIGGDGDDYLMGGAGADALIGGGGENGTSYLTSAGNVVVNLKTGHGSGGDAEGDTYSNIQDVQGSAGDDVITGNSDDNIIDGWYGDDQIASGGGTDKLSGGAGNDTIYGSADHGNEFDGGGDRSNPGKDLLSYERASSGVSANLYGQDDPNEDERVNTKGQDGIVRVLKSSTPDVGGSGFDNVYYAHISTFEDLTGSNFDDSLIADDQYNTIKGLNGDDKIFGMGGNDVLIGGAGKDYLDGGLGIDLADYSGAGGGVTVDLLGLVGMGSDAEGDKLVSIENLRGSDHSDILTGDDNDNALDPGLTRSTMADIVIGGGGKDTLVLDYSRGGNLKGVTGGYDLGSLSQGSFVRQQSTDTTQRDGVVFNTIERLEVTGTAHDDVIFGGAGDDFITTGSGNDLVFTGTGVDRVFAGKGNDIVVAGTDLNRLLSASGGLDPIELDGGAGIDGLSISLAATAESIHLVGNDGTSEFTGVNLVTKNGSGISNFEVVLAAVTGSGDDTITQPGGFDNFFVTGFGVDEIAPGLGHDYVDGGLDYRIGIEIDKPDANGDLTPNRSIDQLYANDGDKLVLDYSSQSAPVIGSVHSAQTGFSVVDGNTKVAVLSNSGHYDAGTNSIDFVNIERLDVTGSSKDDVLVGTSLLFGVNVDGGKDGIVASKSLRGDDHLVGGDGNDLLIGNTGDDTLEGGDGDDVLLGTAVGTGRGAIVDRGEIDTLTGGKGADTFVLGTATSSLIPIIYYNDGTGNVAGTALVGDHLHSGDNRAIITDFKAAEDFIQLAGAASDYRVVSTGGSSFIYLRDGVQADNSRDPANDELIAELKGVGEFDLGAAYVKYVGRSLSAPGLDTVASLDAVLITSEGPQAAALPSIVGRLDAANALVDVAARSAPNLAVQPIAPVVLPGAGLKQAQASPVVPWVTQTDDAKDLVDALFGSDTALSGGKLTVDGDASAFGTFDGDPFGLGHGIVLSTGAVEDLVGPNLVDGGHKIGPSTKLNFVLIGRVGNNDIYRADLSNLGFDLNSIRLGDQSGGSGGAAGIASGFDISAVVLSHAKLDFVDSNSNLNSGALLPRIDAFSFDAANAHFTPGEQRPADGSYPNGPDLRGSVNGLPSFQFDTLDNFDDGSLSLGDGGSLGLNLTQTVSTAGPLYLYVAENGAVGETLSSGFTASSDRLDTPTDLSTDLGAPGVEGDDISLTYRFNPSDSKNPDPSLTQVMFDFVFFSEELVEYAQTEFNDNFKITLNGVNLALLSDGSTASINTLYAPNASASASSSIFTLREDTIESDFIYNPVGTGPTAKLTRADGYSKVLHFVGNIIPGAENVLKIEVKDVRDGLLDSGILVRGGSFVGTTANAFYVDTIDTALAEGAQQTLKFGLTVPPGNHDANPVTVTFHPTEGLDLGAGAGKDVTRKLDPNGTFADALTVTAVADGANLGSRYETVTVELTSLSPVASVAPLVIKVDDSLFALTRTIGDAPAQQTVADPTAFADAWTAPGIKITHTADATIPVPVYSAVDFGTANPTLLSGGDILNGFLGVSGRAVGAPGGVQDISGKEALRFDFASRSVSGLTIEFARFDVGDIAGIELLDAKGVRIRAYSTDQATFTIDGRSGIASVIITAPAGGFMLKNLTVVEQVDLVIARQLGMIMGTAAADTLTGTAKSDTIHGLGGNDTLIGIGGSDALYGDDGNDTLRGGAGNDLLDGGAGIDTASFADATAAVNVSLLISGPEATGGSGTETLVSIENLTGSAFADTLTGDGGNNVLTGLVGKDILSGGAGDDTLLGGADSDILSGGLGDDTFVIEAGGGKDIIDGGAGFDTVIAAAGGVSIDPTAFTAIERISAGGFAGVTLVGGTGADVIDLTGVALIGIAGIATGAGADNVTGSAGDDAIDGGIGNDKLKGGAGNDTIEGGAGNDAIDGGIGNDVLSGSAGADVLTGGEGDDTLIGGTSRDTLTGGLGADVFVLDDAQIIDDIIVDFAAGQDKILLDTDVFKAFGSSPSLTAAQFKLGTSATTLAQRVIYDGATGKLYYDADGSAAGAKKLVATLTNHAALTAQDFTISAGTLGANQLLQAIAQFDSAGIDGLSANDDALGILGAPKAMLAVDLR